MMVIMMVIRLLTFLSLYYGSVVAEDWLVEEIPSPMKEPELCGRAGVQMSIICDVEEKLSAESKNSIEVKASTMWEVEFAVAVVPSMAKYILSSVNAEAERFATTLHTSWGVGDSALQNGCLIFISTDDRVVHISYGAGIQKRISSVDNNRIIEHMKPLLQQKDYGGAIEMAISEINVFVTRETTHEFLKQKQRDKRHFVARRVAPWILGGIFAVLTLIYFYSNHKERRVKCARLAIKRVMRDVLIARDHSTENSSRRTTAASICPACLEKFMTLAEYDRVKSSERVDTSAEIVDDEDEGDAEQKWDGEIQEDPLDDASELTNLAAAATGGEERDGGGVESNVRQDVDPRGNLRRRGVQAQKRPGQSTAYGSTTEKRAHKSVIEVVAVDTSLNRDSYKYSSVPLQIACGHVFCGCCLQLHMKSNSVDKDKCPICKQAIAGDSNGQTGDASPSEIGGEAPGEKESSAAVGGLTDPPLSRYQRQIIEYQTQRLCQIYKGVLSDTVERDVKSSLEKLGTAKGVVSALEVHFKTISEMVKEFEARKRNMDASINSLHRPPALKKEAMGKSN